MTISASRGDALADVRWLVGRPRIVNGAAYLAMAIAWLVLFLSEGFSTMRVVLLVVWLVIGIGESAVAVTDRVYGRGRYARRA